MAVMLYRAEVVELYGLAACEIDYNGVGWEIRYPTFMPRLPEEGDLLDVFLLDESAKIGLFVRFSDEDPIVIDPASVPAHTHQMLSDETLSGMAIDDATRDSLRTKKTGGVT